MTMYTVTLETGLQVQVNSHSVSDALNLAEERFGLHAVDAEIFEPDLTGLNSD